jgi:hypothetical protein
MYSNLDEASRTAVLGGMKSVIAQPHADDSLGRQLIEATSSLLFGMPLDAEFPHIEQVPPDRLARLVNVPSAANLAAELIALSAVVDGIEDDARIELALQYAKQLGVQTPWVDELQTIAAGRMDEAMRLMVVVNAATFPGLAKPGGVPEMLPYEGSSDADRRLHDRYAALEGYPTDSFGRRLWVHFRRHGFRFPGQEGAFAEAFAIPHDSIHVLSDYDTSIQVSCSSARTPDGCTAPTRSLLTCFP